MAYFSVVVIFFSVTFLVFTESNDSCTVTSYSELDDAVSSCTEIVIRDVTVPAGKALEMILQDGAKVTFEGRISFDYKEWGGQLVSIKGKGITVQGASGHVFDGQGGKYWDGLGGNGGKIKPKFFKIQATGGSVFKDINLLDCPKHCVSIGHSQDLTLSNWNIDCSAGDEDKKGHNTDGFDISSSKNILIENSVIRNQDDCVVVNKGSDMKFTGISCYGGHGLSLSVGMSKTDEASNTVSNITFSDSTVQNSRNGIHIKTHVDATAGYIKNITYSNIKLSGITYYGIIVQEDYENGGSSGIPKGNIPITDLTIKNVEGSMTGLNSTAIYILCGDGGCSIWNWTDIFINGNEMPNSCNFTPEGFSC